ncbi:MAG TPA: STM4011 family radical SAM protein [Tepidisphaeraceae bacterium]|jgi:MoaA/NifB/PqqE/SkfB family radical SAM enzyme|nr:STM4011 family radical SAM protein [Tepidisphaeraceae bacterium]
MDLSILYRGTLSSCNYGCEYCPFAKHHETREELAADEKALGRFLDWVGQQGARGHDISVLFTPWGEALIRQWYQQALVRLTNMPHVRKAAIQTNLSCRLEWAGDCDKSRLGLWCTYHPGETTRERFLAKCRELDERQLTYSVGIVGLKEHIAEAEILRRMLPPHVYLWINAYKRVDGYYAPLDSARLMEIDPLFAINATRHPSKGRLCRAGDSVFSVDAQGVMCRCHFIKTAIGNIYEDGWERALGPAACTNQTCGCHIGYVHLPELKLYEVFGKGVLERVPTQIPPRRG